MRSSITIHFWPRNAQTNEHSNVLTERCHKYLSILTQPSIPSSSLGNFSLTIQIPFTSNLSSSITRRRQSHAVITVPLITPHEIRLAAARPTCMDPLLGTIRPFPKIPQRD